MMKKGKCIGAVAAAALIGCVSLFSACGLGEEKQEYDPNKSQVIVGLMQGGMGRAWLDEIAANYMDENPDVEIVIPDPKSSEYNNNNLQNSIETSGIDIYFVNDIYLRDFVAKGLVKDITDIVTEEDENGVSIAGKINNDMLREAFQVDGEYYALPYFMSTFNTVYDVDLFESKNLYFNALANGFVTSKTERRSAGPDGEFCEICEGNGYDYSKHVGCDDGLPATYSQFKTLLSEMRRQTITPYMWCGKHIYYQQRMLAGWWADYEGADNFNLNMTFDGEYTFPAGTLTEEEVTQYGATVNDDGTQTVTITDENAFLLQRQPGKEYGIQLAYDIMSNSKNYATNAPSPSQTNIMAQDEYLNSTTTNTPIAFLAEGGWWENEARTTFDSMARDDAKYAYGTRRFATLPIPKADDGSLAEGRTIFVGGTRSCAIINEHATHPDLAVDFFKYLHSDEAMNIFLKHTGVARPYDFELDQDAYDSLTWFQKEQYNLISDENIGRAFFDLSTNELRLNNISYFNNWLWTSKVGYNDPLSAFYNEPEMTVADYFQGLSDYYVGTWPAA